MYKLIPRCSKSKMPTVVPKRNQCVQILEACPGLQITLRRNYARRRDDGDGSFFSRATSGFLSPFGSPAELSKVYTEKRLMG